MKDPDHQKSLDEAAKIEAQRTGSAMKDKPFALEITMHLTGRTGLDAFTFTHRYATERDRDNAIKAHAKKRGPGGVFYTTKVKD